MTKKKNNTIIFVIIFILVIGVILTWGLSTNWWKGKQIIKEHINLKLKTSKREHIINKEFKGKKICVILFGFSPRSFHIVYKSIEQNIINELKKHYNVDVYHQTLLSRKNKIESQRDKENNHKVDNTNYKLIYAKRYNKLYQEDIKFNLDDYMLFDTDANKNKEMIKNNYKNFLRGIFSEKQAINTFPINKYDVCVMLSSDSLILKPIDIKEIEDVYQNHYLYTTKYNTFGGVANGFYIAKPNILKKICNRIDSIGEWNKYKKDNNITENAEKFIKFILDKHKIHNKYSNIFYIKIRANGNPNSYIKHIDKYNISKKELVKYDLKI